MSEAGVPGFETEEEVEEEPERPPVLTLENVSVEFDMSRGTARVLDDVDLELKRGESVGIVGESGSGKSMLASSMLDAVVDPGVLTGDVTYHRENGEEIDILDLKLADLKQYRWGVVAMVFQGAMNSFNPVLTIRQHFRDTMNAHDANDEETMERGFQLLEDLYLEPTRVLDSYPHELSGGQKQRALIALSLILEPDVLVMDEPTASLDLLMQRSIIDLLTELREKYEFTLVFITHDLPLVKGVCDRLGVMYAFELVELGETNEIIGNSYHPYTRALLNATPNLETPVEDMRPIDGQAPDPVNVPSGCSYHPRCPLADQRCEAEDPNLVEADEDHDVACFYWDDVDGTIPLNVPGVEGGDGADE